MIGVWTTVEGSWRPTRVSHPLNLSLLSYIHNKSVWCGNSDLALIGKIDMSSPGLNGMNLKYK